MIYKAGIWRKKITPMRIAIFGTGGIGGYFGGGGARCRGRLRPCAPWWASTPLSCPYKMAWKLHPSWLRFWGWSMYWEVYAGSWCPLVAPGISVIGLWILSLDSGS